MCAKVSVIGISYSHTGDGQNYCSALELDCCNVLYMWLYVEGGDSEASLDPSCGSKILMSCNLKHTTSFPTSTIVFKCFQAQFKGLPKALNGLEQGYFKCH